MKLTRTAAIACLLLAPAFLHAGPPFHTDDPEPVDLHHWEIYVASQLMHDRGAVTGTGPHLEVNNGLVSNVQVHLILPLAYSQLSGGPMYAGPGDIELGAKYRFVEETKTMPQIGTFPLVEVAVGDTAKGLGAGSPRYFLPVWLQKSWGEWTTYGGGGLWLNPGAGNMNSWFAGWELQRDLSEAITIGAELTYTSPVTPDESAEMGYNIGTIINLSETGHILFSVGRDIKGANLFSGYLAFQWTLGPAS